ncbi:MAG TPA: NAD(P)-dependent oxidoreductase [Gemmatimonadales bacterium]
MRSLVTGATGFVGSHLAETLASRGHEVVALARRPEQHAALTAAGIKPVNGSLENDRALEVALAGVDVVYHVAGITDARNEAEFFAVNETGTRRLLDAVRRTVPGLTRFVHVSSQAAVGPSRRGEPLREEAETHPITSYGRSKLAGELAVRGSELPWAVVRPPAVYGPRDKAFLKLFKLVRRGIAPVFGTGTQELSLVYVGDLVEALILAGTRGEANRQIFHAANREVKLSREVSRAAGTAIGANPMILPVPGPLATGVIAVIERVAAATGQRTILTTERLAEFLAPSWLLNVDKAERLLGWTAKVPLPDGLKTTGTWYKEHGWL